MTPEEKAKRLVDDMYFSRNPISAQLSAALYQRELQIATDCALIAVEEILDFFFTRRQFTYSEEDFAYWNSVKEAINKLSYFAH